MTLDFARRVEVPLRVNGRDLITVVSPRTTLLDLSLIHISEPTRRS